MSIVCSEYPVSNISYQANSKDDDSLIMGVVTRKVNCNAVSLVCVATAADVVTVTAMTEPLKR